MEEMADSFVHGGPVDIEVLRRRSVGCSYKDSCSVLRDGFHNYRIASKLAKWAADDLKEISDTQLRCALKYIDKVKTQSPDIILSGDLDSVFKLVHNYTSELSGIVDNVYYMAAKSYGLSETHDSEERRNIETQLRGHNNELANHLDSFSFSKPLKEFKRMRNNLLHKRPDFELQITYMPKEQRFDMLFGYDIKPEKQVELFGYLFNFYDCILTSTTKTLELIAEHPLKT
jgi:hypothetical protein